MESRCGVALSLAPLSDLGLRLRAAALLLLLLRPASSSQPTCLIILRCAHCAAASQLCSTAAALSQADEAAARRGRRATTTAKAQHCGRSADRRWRMSRCMTAVQLLSGLLTHDMHACSLGIDAALSSLLLPQPAMPASEGINADSSLIRLRARWNGASGPFEPKLHNIADGGPCPVDPAGSAVSAAANAPLDSPPPPSSSSSVESPSASASPVAASSPSASSSSVPAFSGFFRLRRLPDSSPAAYCDAVRRLFREYFAALGIDMAFQNVETELAELPGWKHQREGGGLLLLLEHVTPCDATAATTEAASASASSSAPSRVSASAASSESIILAGCVALKDLGSGICEAKRLFVRPSYRGRDFGRMMLVQLMSIAAQIGYSTIRLDTLARFTAANKLYAALGFQRIEAYKSEQQQTQRHRDTERSTQMQQQAKQAIACNISFVFCVSLLLSSALLAATIPSRTSCISRSKGCDRALPQALRRLAHRMALRRKLTPTIQLMRIGHTRADERRRTAGGRESNSNSRQPDERQGSSLRERSFHARLASAETKNQTRKTKNNTNH